MKNSKTSAIKMKKRVKGVLNTCKAILGNSANNGCVVNTINKKLAAMGN